MTTEQKIVNYLRNHKGGELPRPSCSFTDVKFTYLVKCIGFESAVSFAKYTDTWNSKAPIVLTFKAFLDYENSSRHTKSD